MDLNAEYNNRARVPEHGEMLAGWQREAAAYRETTRCELDQSYGAGAREKYDLFHPEDGSGSAVMIYIHGGYWQRGDRKDYSHVARPFVAQGMSVAVTSYDLCPDVTIPDIISQMRACVLAVWRKTGLKPIVAGHSAGGHLAAAMLGTDWSGIDGGEADLVPGACAISGIFDLAPLIEVDMNGNLNLTSKTAGDASPISWNIDGAGKSLVVAVGGIESSEFLRQARTFAECWGKAGVAVDYVEVENGNHFTALEAFLRPDGAIAKRIPALRDRCAAVG